MRDYCEQRVDLVVGEAYAIESEAREIAKNYGDTAFLMGSSGGPAGDTFGTWNHEAACLAGMLAASMSTSGTFGAVGAIPTPEVNMLINGFRAGVSAVRPDAEHLIGFIGTFFDPPKAARPVWRRSIPGPTSCSANASARRTRPRNAGSGRSGR